MTDDGRLRVLVWGNTYPRMGGVERFVDTFAHGLIERGHDVSVLSDGASIATLTDRPFPVKTVPMGDPIHRSDIAQILASSHAARKTIEAFEPDVIHYNSSALEMPVFVMSAMRTPFPIVSTLHFDLNNPVLVPDEGTFAKVMHGSTRVTSISRYVHSLVPRVGSLRARHVDLIENALPRAQPYRKPPGTKTLLCMGRLIHDKGFDMAVAAMPAVLAQHPQARLIIAGLGPEQEALTAQIAAEGLQDHVSFVGWIDPAQVNARMQDADIVVFPSRWEEPFGLVVIEAALAGRPCVAFRVGAMSEIIEPGVTGELAVPGDVDGLADQINALLSDPQRAEAQGLTAYERHGSGAAFATMLDRYEAVFREAKAGARSPL